ELTSRREAGVRLRARAERTARTLDLDALRAQQSDQRARTAGTVIDQQDVGPVAPDVAVELGVVAQECALARCRGAQRRLAARAMLLCAVPQRQQRSVIALVDEASTTAACLLVCHADRTEQRRPAVAVARIEQVIRFGGEILPAVEIERRRVRSTEALAP